MLTYEGEPLQNESRGTIHLTTIDWNRDGHIDILAGDKDGRMAFIKNTGKVVDAVPQFLPPKFFQQEAKYVDFGALTTPRVFDWDGDGLKDLLVSSKPAVDWMKNMGMKDGKMVLQYMGRVVSRTLMGHTDCPIATDFNKDGIPDLLVGTEIGVFFYWERPSFEVTTTMTTTEIQKPANYKYFKR